MANLTTIVILFHIGDFPIRSYGLVITIAVLLAMGVAYFLARGTIYQKHVPNVVVYVLIGAMAGAIFWKVFFFQWG